MNVFACVGGVSVDDARSACLLRFGRWSTRQSGPAARLTQIVIQHIWLRAYARVLETINKRVNVPLSHGACISSGLENLLKPLTH